MSDFLIQVFARARTYQAGKWRYQDPTQCCPYMLAANGFEITKENTLECSTCHHTTTFDPQNDELKLTSSDLLLHHHHNCLHLNEVVQPILKEDIYLHVDDIFSQLNKEQKLHSIKQFPILNTIEMWNTLEEEPITIRQVMESYSLKKDHINISFFLQFFGWVIKAEPGKECLECYFCGRKALYSDLVLQDTQNQDTTKTIAEQGFDVVNEHRYFCIWVKQFKGWLVYLQYLYDKCSQLLGYKIKCSPIEKKKMRTEIERYLEGFQSKTSETFIKLQNIIQDCEQLNERIIKDTNIHTDELATVYQSSSKRFREHQEEINSIMKEFDGQMKCLKRIKLN